MTETVKLTEKQKSAMRAIVALGNDPLGRRPREFGATPSIADALCSKGLLVSGRVYGSPVSYRFTERGRTLTEGFPNDQ